MVRSLVALSALVIVMLAAPWTAAAQTATNNVAVSYSYLHDPDLNLPVGWVFAGAAPLSRTIGLVGEAAGNYGSKTFDDTTLRLQTHAFLGGVRLQHAVSAHVRPFGQFLLGTTVASASMAGEHDSVWAFTMQPGGGVDVTLAQKVGLRVQGDVPINRKDGESFRDFRMAVGLVFAVGPRRDKQATQ